MAKSRYKDVPSEKVEGSKKFPGNDKSAQHPRTGSGDGTTKIDPHSEKATARYGSMKKGAA